MILRLSTGKVKLPDVRGMTFDDAHAKLNRAQFTNIAAGPKDDRAGQGEGRQGRREDPTPG